MFGLRVGWVGLSKHYGNGETIRQSLGCQTATNNCHYGGHKGDLNNLPAVNWNGRHSGGINHSNRIAINSVTVGEYIARHMNLICKR